MTSSRARGGLTISTRDNNPQDTPQSAPALRAPTSGKGAPAVVAVLLGAALTHRVPRVAFLVYAPADDLVDEVATALVEGFVGAGMSIGPSSDATSTRRRRC